MLSTGVKSVSSDLLLVKLGTLLASWNMFEMVLLLSQTLKENISPYEHLQRAVCKNLRRSESCHKIDKWLSKIFDEQFWYGGLTIVD